MPFDAAIAARHPAAVAGFIAALWGTRPLTLPPVPGRFVALAGDGSGAGVEVHPLAPAAVGGRNGPALGTMAPGTGAATRLVIGTAGDEAEVHLAAGMRGWQSWRSERRAEGGAWRVIEVWAEERLLIEVLTPEMQAAFHAARAGAAAPAAPGEALLVAA